MTTQSLLMGCRPVNNSFVTKTSLLVCLVFVYQTGLAGDKTIDGGAGTNAVEINVGIDLDAFSSISYDGSEIYTFTVSGSDLSIKNFDSLSVNSVAWTNLVGDGGTRSHTSDMCAGYSRNDGVFSAPAANKVVLFDWDSTSSSNITNLCLDTSTLGSSFSQSGGHYSATVYGTSINDIVMVDNGWVSTITMGDGDDVVHSKDSDAPDDIDMGAGDDFLIISSDTNDTSLDGGSGSDWLAFRTVNSGGSAQTYTLNSGNASNFENLLGSDSDDTLTGDANANILVGSQGADTINGGDGNDVLWGDCLSGGSCSNLISQNYSSYSISTGGNDILNGGAGDDTLYGEDGDDTIDGGAGNDTLTGGAGIDTFVIREDDGGSSISDADTITDFTDGTDIIGMSGLNYSDLTIEQGTGSYSSHVIVKKTDSGEFLTIIQNISLGNIDDNDFSAI